MKLHHNTVRPELLSLIKDVFGDPFFNGYRLVGGTSLSLQIGHRSSVDADFFLDGHGQPVPALKKHLVKFHFDLRKEEPNAGVLGITGSGVKLDVFDYGDPFVLPALEVDGMRLASLVDIGLMKLDVQRRRNAWKDLIDLHQIIRVHPIEKLLELYPKRYLNVQPKQAFMALLNNLKNPPADNLYPRELMFIQIEPIVLIKELTEECMRFSEQLILKEAQIIKDRLKDKGM
jgi:Nucleotidyl transferase AbiEii toxin, Type IV TA system